MALNGRLEDMNLLEILQIVAFSKKTGTLELTSSLARGAVLFRNGHLLCAFSSASFHVVESLSERPMDDERRALLEHQMRTALRELTALREGRFEFRIRRELPTRWAGLDVATFLASDGIDPQQILLELAHELDEAREDTERLFEDQRKGEPLDPPTAEREEPPADPPKPAVPTTVLLVDDEPLVLQVVGEEISGEGLSIETASDTPAALESMERLSRSGQRLVLLTDLSIPTSANDSFEGGFELVGRLRAIQSEAPVLLMAESLSPSARERARVLRVRKIAFKPALTKLDPDEYRADLRSFAKVVRRELQGLLTLTTKMEPGRSKEPELNHDVIFDFLSTMTEQLTSPANGISRMVLRVASKYVERALLFLVKSSEARGLAGIREGQPTSQVTELARVLRFELQGVRPFAEVVYSRECVRIEDSRELGRGFDPGNASEAMLFPLLLNHEVLAVLYCDNPNTGAPLGKLTGLQLFLVQAGMALENASLRRKVQSLEHRYSLEDQGPLTEELTPIVRNLR